MSEKNFSRLPNVAVVFRVPGIENNLGACV